MDDTEPLDRRIVWLARFKARQLAGRYGFHTDEIDDLQQELLFDYVKRLKRFEPQRCGRHTFARMVMDHRVATLIESKMANCRDYRLCQVSLDSVVLPSTVNLLERYVTAPGDTLCRNVESSVSERCIHLRVDVGRLIDSLPPTLSLVCRLVMTCDTLAEVALKAGISRSTVHRRQAELQRIFDAAGLRNYHRDPMKPSSSQTPKKRGSRD